MNKKEEYNAKVNAQLKELLYINKGRMHRLDYLSAIFVLNFFADLVDFIPEDASLLYWVPGIMFLLLVGYFSLSVLAKRLRDIGLSGWFSLPILILVGIIPLSLGLESIILKLLHTGIIVITAGALLFWPPQKKDNKYGKYDAFSLLTGFPKDDQKKEGAA